MPANTDDAALTRTAPTTYRMGAARRDRAQLAATLRWLRELRPVQREPLPAARRARTPA